MPVESAADRALFLSVADFGCVFTLQPAGGGVAVSGLAGIFDHDFLPIEGDGGQSSVMTRSPRLLARTADLVNEGRQGDIVTITAAPSQPELTGRLYRVTQPRPDGTGLTLLWLERL